MGQFEKVCTRNDITMDIIETLENPDALDCGSKIEKIPGKVQNKPIHSNANSHYVVAQGLDQTSLQERSTVSSYVLSSFTLKFYELVNL